MTEAVEVTERFGSEIQTWNGDNMSKLLTANGHSVDISNIISNGS